MPRTTREWALRKIDSALGNIDWTGTHLEEVKQRYHEQHPEISTAIIELQRIALILDEGIKGLKKII